MGALRDHLAGCVGDHPARSYRRPKPSTSEVAGVMPAAAESALKDRADYDWFR
jgi:hypothetical protein